MIRRIHPLVLTTILLLIQLVLFLFLSTRPQRLAPSDRMYPPVGYGYYYINVMRQSIDGAWNVRDPGTTRPVLPARIYTFFTALGKLAKITRADPILVYEISHISGGVALFFATYWFISNLVPAQYRLFAIILSLAYEVTPFGDIGFWSQAYNLIPHHFGLPHHVWGEVLGMLSFGLLLSMRKKTTLPGMLLLFVLGFIATETLPSYMFIVAIPVFGTLFLYGLLKGSVRQMFQPAIVLAAAIAIAGLLLKVEFSKGLPYTNFAATEKSWTNAGLLTPGYLQTLLVYVPFMLMLVVAAVKKWSAWTSNIQFVIALCVAWILTPLIGMRMAAYDWFPMASWRLIEGHQYLPLGILSAIGIAEGVSLISDNAKKQFAKFIILTAIVLYSGYATTVYSMKKIEAQNQMPVESYPLKSTMKAVYFVDSLPKHSGIMALQPMGEMLPGFANITIFIDGPTGYTDWHERKELARQFFTGTMTETEAKSLLSNNGVDYVFYGPDERAISGNSPLYPGFLKEIFTTASVTIFSYQK